MKIELLSDKDFIIIDGHIMTKNNEPFYVKKDNDVLVIADTKNFSSNSTTTISGRNNIVMSGNGISISGNTILVNGLKINASGKALNIEGQVDSIILNGNRIDVNNTSEIEEELDEDQIKFYTLDNGYIDSILVKGQGKIEIEDFKTLCDNSLNLSVKGSGDIVMKESKGSQYIGSLNAQVQGSGDIKIRQINSSSSNCNVMGSGDIDLISCDFSKLMLNVMGSGDITGKNTKAQNVSKNIMGSGDINGL